MDRKEIKRLYKCAQEFCSSKEEIIEYYDVYSNDIKYFYYRRNFTKFKTIAKLIKIINIFENNKKKAYLKLISKLIKKAIRYTKISKHIYKPQMIEALEDLQNSFESIIIIQNNISVRDVFEELVALKNIYSKIAIDGKWCNGEREDNDLQGITIDTEPITLDDDGIKYNLGRFRIHLNYDCKRNIEALDPKPCYYHDGIVHPHVRDGYLCEGEAANAITIALKDLRLVDFFDLVNGVLHTYSSDNPFCRLDEWEGQPCVECNCAMSEDEGFYCERCEKSPLCDDCMERCSSCRSYFCSECMIKCSSCKQKRCKNCIVECSTCEDLLCEDCNYVCNDCGNCYCAHCSKECSECNKTFCNECDSLNKCKLCNKLLCNGCIEGCLCCDDIFCSEHLTNGCCSNCLEEREQDEEISDCPA